MQYTRSEYLDKVLAGYKSSYNITTPEAGAAPEELGLAACAEMHLSEGSYVISRKVETWSVNSHEYVYFFSIPKLNAALAQQCIDYIWSEGMKKIDPAGMKNHMCTRLAAVFICDEADEAAMAVVKKCRLYKSFQFSLKGWAECHTAAADLGTGTVVSNRYGTETAAFLKNVLDPSARKKGRNPWGIIKQMLG